MKININGVTRDMTAQEEAEYMASIADLAEDYENGEISTEDALKKLFHLLGTKLTLTDEEAVENAYLYDEWKPDIKQTAGLKQTYHGALYKVKDGVQDFTSQSDWTPDVAVSLYERVANPTESGTRDNPISYAQIMAIENGKYYAQNGVIYYCFRDMPAMPYDLSVLIEQYVRVAD